VGVKLWDDLTIVYATESMETEQSKAVAGDRAEKE
jgi:hypothetical protein